MKKYLSVLLLLAQHTLYPILGVLLGMVGVETVLFYFMLRKGPVNLEQAFSQSGIVFVFGTAYLIILVLLYLTGCEFGGKQSYTLRRLSVCERSVFLWQGAYNSICLLLLWAVQVAMALALCNVYLSMTTSAFTSGQTVFLAFYRSPFLHSLLPLADVSRYVRNLCSILALGFTGAGLSFRQRRGKKGFAAILVAIVTLVCFQRDLGNLNGNYMEIFFVLALAIYTVVSVWKEPTYGN